MSNLTSISFNTLWLGDLQLTPTRVITSILVALIAVGVYQSHKGPRRPRLQGPRSESFLFGITKKLLPSPEIGLIYQGWERIYGSVYEIPASMGSRDVVLGDPKAIAYLFSKDTVTYHQPALQRAVSRATYGNNLMAMEGEAHKRQRRALSSAFSISAIRDLAPVLLDTAGKLKLAWDSIFDSSDGLNGDGVIIDIQKWMNCVSLDSVGKAGFSHDFGTLRGESSSIMAGLDTFNAVKPSLAMMVYILIGPLFPGLFARIPIKRQEKLVDVVAGLESIAINLLDKASKETEEKDADRSALGVMIRSESASSTSRLSADEIIAQNMLILAGYETTAMTLTWAFIELARCADIQKTLRAELRSSFVTGEDVMYDRLMNLPYLDAFVCEVLRLHPALPQVVREVHEDDTIPLTNSILTASGTVINSLFVTKRTVIRIPLAGVNLSETVWGPNARIFDPGRWLASDDDGQGKKEEVKGYRHLLTFAYGPRMCLARNLAIAEIKTVLSVLVHNFSFEFPDGPMTKLESHFLHPKVAGEEGIRVPVLTQRII